MSVLFSPGKIGSLELKNRFIHSATYEGMAAETGEVSDRLVKRYQTLAKGDIGLIIPGYCFVHRSGKAFKYQIGIHMEETLAAGHADFLSMSRPFIREPAVVKKMKEGKTDVVACVSCNRCLAAASRGVPVKCYYKGIPRKERVS